MALLLIACLLGLFGDGPLSRAKTGSPRTMTVQYDRLLRSSAPAEYGFEANPAVVTGHELRLRFDQSLMDGIEIDSIVPQPETEEAGPNSTEFAFRVKANTSVKVNFRYRPTTFGRRSGRVSVGGHAVLIDQFVYP